MGSTAALNVGFILNMVKGGVTRTPSNEWSEVLQARQYFGCINVPPNMNLALTLTPPHSGSNPLKPFI